MRKGTHDGRYAQLAKKDLHVHTPYCKHASGEMEEYVLAAIDRGLEEIGFLAHAEAGIDHPRILWLVDGEFEDYWRRGQELKDRYRDRIRVSVGLELGLNPFALDEMQAIMRRCPWDRIGLSYHQMQDGDGYLNICSRQSAARIQQIDGVPFAARYYRDLREHLPVVKPYMLCHLDVVRKFLMPSSEEPVMGGLVVDLLDQMARLGVRLEVNTSGYERVGAPYPEPWIIRSAVEMGIELVLNSDSHAPEQVGRHFQEAVRYIEDSLMEGTPAEQGATMRPAVAMRA